MIIRTLIIILLLYSNYCKGQTTNDTNHVNQKIILTKTQNNKWLDSLKQLSSEKQVELIIERVISDTNVFIRHSYADRIIIDYSVQEKTKYEGCCKPSILIINTNTYFNFGDKFYKGNISVDVPQLCNTLKEIKVDTISVINDVQGRAIWGTDIDNGVIIIKVTDKKSIKLIKKRFRKHKW